MTSIVLTNYEFLNYCIFNPINYIRILVVSDVHKKEIIKLKIQIISVAIKIKNTDFELQQIP